MHNPYIPYAVRIHLDQPRRIDRYLLFTRMTLRFKKRRPADSSVTRTLNTAYVSGTFNWAPAF